MHPHSSDSRFCSITFSILPFTFTATICDTSACIHTRSLLHTEARGTEWPCCGRRRSGAKYRKIDIVFAASFDAAGEDDDDAGTDSFSSLGRIFIRTTFLSTCSFCSMSHPFRRTTCTSNAFPPSGPPQARVMALMISDPVNVRVTNTPPECFNINGSE